MRFTCPAGSSAAPPGRATTFSRCPLTELSLSMLSRHTTLAFATTLALAAHAAPLVAQAPRSLGIDTANFDRSVRPQDDLFRFVNGGWLKRTPIPSDAPRWGTFDELDERSRESMRTVLETAASSSAAGRLRGAKGRRLLRELSRLGTHRVARRDAAEGRARAHRRHLVDLRPARRLRATLSARRRTPVRRRRRTRPEEVGGEHRAGGPVRSRPSRPRLLSDAGRADEHRPPGVSGLPRAAVHTRGDPRSDRRGVSACSRSRRRSPASSGTASAIATATRRTIG